MKNKVFIIFIIAAFLLAAVLIYIFSPKPAEKYIWAPTMDQDSKQPYDFTLLQEILKDNYTWERVNDGKLTEKLKAADPENTAYIFAGPYPYHNVKNAKALLEFAENGGEVLIISHSVPDSLMEQIAAYKSIENYFWLNTESLRKIKVSFSGSGYSDRDFSFAFKSGIKDTSEYKWSYIPDNMSDQFNVLGSFSDYSQKSRFTNFASMKIGKGYFYWHTNPLLFTNLYLSRQNINGFEHLNSFLSHFKTKKWIWDFASTMSPPGKSAKMEKQFDKPKTPMEYIFSQAALRLAWILLMAAALLYALFGAKRKQQSIPILEGNRNTSLEFINTIGRLYFQQQNHKVIFEKIMQLFRSHLRRRYGILLKDEDLNNEEKISLLVKKTDIDRTIISDIFENYLMLKAKLADKNVEMSAETLNNFYLKTDRFYKAEQARKHITKTV